MLAFFGVLLSCIGQIIASLNTIVLSNDTFSAGFFDLMIGFVLVEMIVHNLIMYRS